MNYTKHKVIRTKILNEKYYEVIFEPRTLNFSPGSLVECLNGDKFLVASGVKEAWARLIVAEDRVPKSSWGISLKILNTNKLYWHKNFEISVPDLIDDPDPSFIVWGEGIAIPLSYISTFPDRKIEITYLESHPIHLDWLKVRTNLKTELEKIPNKKYYTLNGYEGLIIHG